MSAIHIPAEVDPRQRLQLLDELLDRALSLNDSEVPDFLSAIPCPKTRSELEQLLTAGNQTLDLEKRWQGVLDGVAEKACTQSLTEPGQGDVIGPWRLDRVVGRGGMGTVFLADRCDGVVEMQAAVKISNQLCFDLESRNRFEQERRILARFQHPSIARFIDGGVTEHGVSYYAMELVDGESIDLWCDRRGLSIEERLRLFVDLVRAVEAAHRQLVLHRDLKPSNVLVTGDGEVKLLDFGIARLIEHEHRGGTTCLMTPEYATPEQCLGQPLSLASDIYQLGLLLYELLTGHRPQRMLDHSSSRQIQRICELDPPSPSSWIRGRPEGVQLAAEQRATTARNLRRGLQGDLDTIVAKAIHKDPERRYRSAGELAADVELHLQGLPITARSDTVLYRTSKFVRRRLGTIALGSAALLAMACLTLFYTAQVRHERNLALIARDQAEVAQARSEEARQASDRTLGMLVDLLESVDPWKGEITEESVRRLLSRGHARALSELRDQPLTQARLLSSIGWMRARYGDYAQAEQSLDEALRVYRQHSGDGLETSRTLLRRAKLAKLRGHYQEAESYFQATFRALDQMRAPRSSMSSTSGPGRLLKVGAETEIEILRGTALSSWGDLLWKTTRYDESQEALGRALDILSTHSPESRSHSSALLGLGNLHFKRSQYQQAEDHWLQALSIRRRLVNDDSLDIAPILQNLGLVALARGEHATALDRFREAGILYRRHLGESAAPYAKTVANLGTTYKALGRFEEAESHLDRATRIFETNLGPEHPELIPILGSKADLADQRGLPEEREELTRRSLHIVEKTFGEHHCRTSVRYTYWGLALEELGRLQEAESALRRSVQIMAENRKVESQVPQTYDFFAAEALGSFYLRHGRATEAEALLQDALKSARAGYGPESKEAEETRSLLAGLPTQGKPGPGTRVG